MKYALREYQSKCNAEILEHWKQGNDPVLVAPCGAGKTKIAAKILFDKMLQGRQVAFFVHRDTLIEQTRREFEEWGMGFGIVAGGYEENRRAKIQLVSCQSLASRSSELVKWFEPEYGIADECHITAFNKALQELYPPLGEGDRIGRFLGITATPRRLDKKNPMSKMFQHMVRTPSSGELMDMGFLVKPTYNIAPNIKLGKMTYSIEYVWSTFIGVGADIPAIIFAPSVAQAYATEKYFQDRGIVAAAITEKTPRKERENIFDRYKAGEVAALIAKDVLKEGFNATNATHLIAGADTESNAGAVQMFGRVLRPHTFANGEVKSSAIISDLVGLVERHGRVEFHTYSIADLDVSDIPEPGEIPTKTCPDCLREVFAPLEMCNHCGHIFEITKKRVIAPQGHILQLLTDKEREQQNYYKHCLLEAFEAGKRPKSADNKYRVNYGFLPPKDWRRMKVVEEDRAIEYKKWLLGSTAANSWIFDQLAIPGMEGFIDGQG